MNWISQYQLFLFDFDGLLVNTEHLHFEAYRLMCQKRGFSLDWDFDKFCAIAHRDAVGLQKEIYKDLPGLHEQEPKWDVLYAEKKAAYQHLLQVGDLQLMPGVAEFLAATAEKGIKRCVVTNSTKQQTDVIKERLPLLKTIPHWVTRENYKNPKPAPDGYLKALADLAEPGDQVMGFEDTLRGYMALEEAEVKGILVSSCLSPEFKEELSQKQALHFLSFNELSEAVLV